MARRREHFEVSAQALDADAARQRVEQPALGPDEWTEGRLAGESGQWWPSTQVQPAGPTTAECGVPGERTNPSPGRSSTS